MEMTPATFHMRIRTDNDAEKNPGHFEDKPVAISATVQAAIDQLTKMGQLNLRYGTTSNHLSFMKKTTLYIISDKTSFRNEFENKCSQLGYKVIASNVANSQEPSAVIIGLKYNLVDTTGKILHKL